MTGCVRGSGLAWPAERTAREREAERKSIWRAESVRPGIAPRMGVATGAMPADHPRRPENGTVRLGEVGVRSVAIFEGAKGLIVLAAGFGLLSLLHRDIDAVAESVIRHLHLNPAHRYPGIFIHAATRMDGRLGLLAAGAFSYALFRLVEAYGLWHERPWAEWLAIVSAGLYLPVEVYELWRHLSVVGALVTAGNVGLVAGLLYIRLSAIRRPT